MIEYQDNALQSFLGSGVAIADTVVTKIFINDLVDYAYALTTNDFNRDAAAYAIATKKINHMFEWGSAGINPIPNGPSLNPNSAVARLWRHTIKGPSTNKIIGFDFKPSKVPVPLPTPPDGVSLEEWRRNQPKRKHIFHWKAAIMELGTPVTIKPRYGEAMFIP